MTVEIQDVLNANVVLLGIGLLNTPKELEDFQNSINAEVRSAAGAVVLGLQDVSLEAGRKFDLPRERVSLESSSARTTIQREYPAKADLKRLSDIVCCALKHTDTQGQSPQAFGYNIELVYNQTSGQSAIQYLGQRLFDRVALVNGDMELAGGLGQILLDSPTGRWTVRVEPRFGEESATRVFMAVNYHRQEHRIPDVDEISRDLQEIWEKANSFATRLDQGTR